MPKYDKEGHDRFEFEDGEDHVEVHYFYGIEYDYDQDPGTGRYRFCGMIDIVPQAIFINGMVPKENVFDRFDLLDDLRFEVRMNHL